MDCRIDEVYTFTILEIFETLCVILRKDTGIEENKEPLKHANNNRRNRN